MSIIWQEGGIIQAVVRGTYLGQGWVNRYGFYVQTVVDSGESVASFVDAFYDAILVDVLNIQNEGVAMVDVVVSNPSFPEQGVFVDNEAHAGTLVGGTSLYMPSSVAVGFRLLTELGIARSGWKRYPGLLEGNCSGNTLVAGANSLITLLETLEDSLAAEFTTAAGNVFHLAVLMHDLPDPVNAYKVLSAVYRPDVSTQNTRKP